MLLIERNTGYPSVELKDVKHWHCFFNYWSLFLDFGRYVHDLWFSYVWILHVTGWQQVQTMQEVPGFITKMFQLKVNN